MALNYTLSLKMNQETSQTTNKLRDSQVNSPEDQGLQDLGRWLGSTILSILENTRGLKLSHIEEIRMRVNKPLLLHTVFGDVFLSRDGITRDAAEAYIVKYEDLAETLEKMTQSSFYAAQEYIREGFITLPGGHRVGLTGKAVMNNGTIQTIRHVTALNIRIAKAINFSHRLLPLLFKEDPFTWQKEFCHTLIISPPRAGKTTLLRSLIYHLSNGMAELGIKGQTVGVVDERGELAGMWQGIPFHDLGMRTDVLEGCPKFKGITILVRSMAPQIIATDELGHRDDFEAISEALRCGVRILSTAHASSLDEALARPILGPLIAQNVFERLIILSRRQGPGTIEGVIDLKTSQNLWGDGHVVNR